MRAVTAACAVGVLVLTPTMAAAQEPEAAPLTGETLVTSPGPSGGNDVQDVQGSCARAGNTSGPSTGTSSFTYRAEGVATGPYPGTFSEFGSFTIGPINEQQGPGQFRGQLTHFQASYSIDSVVGQVKGTKTLATPGFNVGVCQNLSNDNRPDEFVGQIMAEANYEAIITLPDGAKYRDTGYSFIAFNFCKVQNGCSGDSSPGNFEETYYSLVLELVSPPPAPTTREQCKNGGFRNFPAQAFKNQGDCVAFVQTRGRNEPGQNQPRTP